MIPIVSRSEIGIGSFYGSAVMSPRFKSGFPTRFCGWCNACVGACEPETGSFPNRKRNSLTGDFLMGRVIWLRNERMRWDQINDWVEKVRFQGRCWKQQNLLVKAMGMDTWRRAGSRGNGREMPLQPLDLCPISAGTNKTDWYYPTFMDRPRASIPGRIWTVSWFRPDERWMSGGWVADEWLMHGGGVSLEQDLRSGWRYDRLRNWLITIWMRATFDARVGSNRERVTPGRCGVTLGCFQRSERLTY